MLGGGVGDSDGGGGGTRGCGRCGGVGSGLWSWSLERGLSCVCVLCAFVFIVPCFWPGLVIFLLRFVGFFVGRC